MKSTKAMETPMGCVVQVTTQQRSIDGTYVPGAAVKCDSLSGIKYLGIVEVHVQV